MTERSVTHATFAIERTYHAAPEQDAFLTVTTTPSGKKVAAACSKRWLCN